MSITSINPRLWIAVVALLAAVVLLPGRAHAANVTVDLCATTGTISVPATPAAVSVPILGYVAGDCTTAATATAPGGPVVSVAVGDQVTVNLHNNLGETTGLLFQGQSIVPDLAGTAGGTVKSYTFTAGLPGTYLYEAALLPNAQHQVAMGLYGALIVRPAAGQAYDGNTTYDEEAVLVLSEIDPALNASPAAFDMRNYKPKYWLVNGQVYPNTASFTTAAGHNVLLRYVNAGMQHHSMTALGLTQKVIAVDGSLLADAHTIVAETIAPGQTLDAIATVPPAAAAGSKYPVYDGNLVMRNSNTAGFGGMLTFLSIAPGVAGPDTQGPDTAAVTLSPNRTNGAAAVALAATVSDAAKGNSNVSAAEYFVDTAGANGTGTALGGTYGSPTVNVNGTLSPAALAVLASGSHTIYVHGVDALGNWGSFNFAVLTLDKSGPQTTGLALSTNPSNGTVAVTLTGTANDSTTGGSNAAAAEYFVGTPGTSGTGTPLALNTTSSPVASLSATIAAASINALPTGSYVLNVHSRDALGNWGAFATINLNVDKAAPTVSAVTAKPNPTNGLISGSASQPAVQVDATFVDAGPTLAASIGAVADGTSGTADGTPSGIDPSMPVRAFIPLVMSTNDQEQVAAAAVTSGNSFVQAAEAFVYVANDHVPAASEYGTGSVFTANDGSFNSATEAGRTPIPLNTILQLTDGNHNVYVHAKDSAGNWGPVTTLVLVVDKVAPTFTGITLAPNTFALGTVANVVLTLNGAADNVGGTGIGGGEYWFGTTDPAPGGGTAFNGLTANIPTSSLAVGTYTVRARVRDAAGNWSTGANGIRSATLTVTWPPFYFSTSGSTNPPGVGGTADDSDIYFYNSGFSRAVDVSAITRPVPSSANVDGLVRVDNTHFYLSFTDNVTLPVLGTVQDEDIVFYNAGTWSVYFDGTARGLTNNNQDIDAFDIVGSTIYFSTSGNTNPPGVGGAADDADIYAWNGTAFSRVFDASANGVPGNANVDGLSLTDTTHFYLSFNADTTLPGIGAVQDEDIVRYNAGTWSVYIDGTALGLTNSNQDLDAIDIP